MCCLQRKIYTTNWVLLTPIVLSVRRTMKQPSICSSTAKYLELFGLAVIGFLLKIAHTLEAICFLRNEVFHSNVQEVNLAKIISSLEVRVAEAIEDVGCNKVSNCETIVLEKTTNWIY